MQLPKRREARGERERTRNRNEVRTFSQLTTHEHLTLSLPVSDSVSVTLSKPTSLPVKHNEMKNCREQYFAIFQQWEPCRAARAVPMPQLA